MKMVAAVFADFEQTFLGGPSQLQTPLGGRPVIQRTLTRLMRVEGLDARCLFVRPRDRAVAEAAVRAAGLDGSVEVLAADDGHRRRRELIRAARKWNLHAWRGGLLGTTWFDEYVEAHCVARVLEHYACDAVLCLDGHQPMLDSRFSGQMLARRREYGAETEFVFTQAPPGLAGVLLGQEIVQRLLKHDVPLGVFVSYRPELPRVDPINQPMCVQIDASVAQTPARLTADTRRSRELLAAALAELGDEPSSAELCSWLRRPGHDPAGPLPLEVEIELTTEDPLPQTRLRPRGARVPRRCLQDMERLSELARELGAYDDRLVVLGGHGDPLAHAGFGEACRRVREGGVCGLAVVTPMTVFSEEAAHAMFSCGVDVVQVRVDADTRETYRALHGADLYERVVANVTAVERARRERLRPQPIVVCSITRCAATLPELEPFYSRWVQATGWSVIEGFNDYGGLLPPDSLVHSEPPVRGPCRRLDRRLMLLADGSVALCGQDVVGEFKLGRWTDGPISDIWAGRRLADVRTLHSRGEWGNLPICGRCREWFRP